MSKSKTLERTETAPLPVKEDLGLVIFQQVSEKGLAHLPPEVQKALAQYDLREEAGIAPQWKPEKMNEFLIGQVLSVRKEVTTEYGDATIVTMQTLDGPVAIFLGADLRIKLGNAEPGQRYVITYTGLMTKAQNPKLKNDMKTYSVIEVQARS